MAVSSFIPTVWASQIQKALEKKKVSQFFVNHNYEGEVMQAGSVKINQLADVTLRDYVTGTDITYEDASLSDLTLNINRNKYFAVNVDDVNKVQMKSDLMVPLANNGAERIASDLDAANFAEMTTNAGVTLGTDVAPISVTTPAEAKALVLQMKNAADTANVPSEGRVLAADYALENQLLADTTINLAPPTANDTLKAGYIGKLYGIEIYSSNNMPKTQTNKNVAILSTAAFTTEADQLTEIEALRSEKSFKDVIRGLSVSGRKVTMPAGVIRAIVTYTSAGAEG